MTAVFTYTAERVATHDDMAAALEAPGTTWVHAADADAETMDRVAEVFDLHPLAIEDIRNGVRPKTEEFGRYTFVLVKDATLRRGETSFEEEIGDEPLGLFLGEDWLVTLAPGPVDRVDRVVAAVRSEDGRLLDRGPDFLAYRVIDVVVDEYFEVLDDIEGQIEAVEEAVLESTDIETLEGINSVRRELLSFRKLAWPTREAIGTLARGDPPQVDPATEKYYRDVYDHLVQLVDLTETYRDLASGARDIYLNALSQSTNEVMKVLTTVATIFIPLTFVVGIYGMNFSGGPYNMPELSWTYGYPAVMLGMLGIALAMVAFFRRRDYI